MRIGEINMGFGNKKTNIKIKGKTLKEFLNDLKEDLKPLLIKERIEYVKNMMYDTNGFLKKVIV
jgi:hypothetical protein